MLLLYEQNELTSAISRVVEDITHRFTVEVLTRPFRSSEYAIPDNNLIRERSDATVIPGKLDVKKTTEELKKLLEIKNRDEQKIEITEGVEICFSEHLYVKITEKAVLYSREAAIIYNIGYINVERCLKSLPSSLLVTY